MLKKNDIKYIIKKVIIILITGFIFFNISKCNVYALSDDYYFEAYNANSNSTISTTAPTSPYMYSVNTYLTSGVSFHFYYYYAPDVFDNVLFFIFEYNNKNYLFANYYKFNSDYNISDLSYYKVEYNSQQLTPSYPPNIVLYDSQDQVICGLNSGCNLSSSYTNSFSYAYYEIDLENATLVRKTDVSLNHDILENGTIVYTNSSVPLHVNDIVQDIPVNIPSNYTKLDLTGYQAVLITPINYETMVSNSSHTTQPAPGVFNTYLDFIFYSQYCTRPSLINISNTKDVILNENGVNIGGAASLSGTCPTEPTSYTLSYQYDMYTGYIPYGLLIYNTQINQEDNWNNSNTYMTSYVWYDSSLYNYEFISDLSSLDLNIDYIDYTGENKSLVVEQLPSLDELFQNALDTYNQTPTEKLDSNKLQNFLDFIKLPFNFLSNLNTFSCKPLNMPFPHTDTTFTIPCMSTIYEEHLPPALINILEVIINGLLFYRITISNIAVVRSILDPTDDKLEVLEL